MKIVIIGGNAAGMSAASRARRNDPKAEITVYEKDDTVSYGACGLPYFVEGLIPDSEDLIAVSLQDFIEKRKISVHILHEVRAIQPRSRTISIYDRPNDRTISVTYDRLIIATGARAVVPPIPGADHERVFKLRTLDDGKQIDNFIRSQKPKSALIVGGGYIGLEMAEALSARGVDVSIVEMLPHIMPLMDEDMAAVIHEELVQKNVQVYANNAVKEIVPGNNGLDARLADGRTLSADFILMSVGVRPNTKLAESCGIELGPTGAIRVNDRMQTSIRDIFAAGDCAEAKHLVTNKPAYIPLGTTANKQGRIAGDNATGKASRFKGIVGTSAFKVFDLEAAMTGLTSRELERLQLPFKAVKIKSRTRAHYYPNPKSIHVKLLFNPQNGRLYGGQIVGGEGAAKRIDVLATALHQKMTVNDLAELDLSYAPPFAPVWDSLLIAANQAVKLIRE